MKIEARAPTRVDLAGGTLDIWPLYLFHPGAVTVNCAITRYASCVIEAAPRGSRRITLVSLDTQRRESFASLAALERASRYRLPLLAETVKFFRPAGGFALTTNSEAPAGAGISGSSAMAVAMCAAFDRFAELSGVGPSNGALAHPSKVADTAPFNAALTAPSKVALSARPKKRTKEDWIHISRDIEAIVIRVPTGTQDHYPAAFGGVNAIHLEAGGERRESLPCNLDELDRRLVLCYTGKPRQSGINNWEVFKRHLEGDKRVWRNLEEIAGVAREIRKAVAKNSWEEAGRLVRREWEFRRRSLPTITTPTIDRIIAAGRRNGALGGKVCGAGGGGCVALLVEPESRARVEAAVAGAGGELLPQRVDRRGVRVRTN